MYYFNGKFDISSFIFLHFKNTRWWFVVDCFHSIQCPKKKEINSPFYLQTYVICSWRSSSYRAYARRSRSEKEKESREEVVQRTNKGSSLLGRTRYTSLVVLSSRPSFVDRGGEDIVPPFFIRRARQIWGRAARTPRRNRALRAHAWWPVSRYPKKIDDEAVQHISTTPLQVYTMKKETKQKMNLVLLSHKQKKKISKRYEMIGEKLSMIHRWVGFLNLQLSRKKFRIFLNYRNDAIKWAWRNL